MKKIICLLLLFILQQNIIAQNPLNIVITGECSYGGGVYTYIGLLNGKNNYSYTFTLDNAPATSVLGFHNNKWIIYADGVIDNVGFQNTNVPVGLLPPFTGWTGVECPDDTMIITDALSTTNTFNVDQKVLLFPNPATDFLVVQNQNTPNEMFNYQIMNISGRIIKNNKQNFGNKIDIQTLNTGHYTITIQNSEGNKTVQKFIKG